MEPPPAKRARIGTSDASVSVSIRAPSPDIARSVSPRRRKKQDTGLAVGEAGDVGDANDVANVAKMVIIPSPWQLTKIQDLPDSLNRDAISLKDVLGDPLITEIWNFNFQHDIDFIMHGLDRGTRHLVKLHVVHGFWKREDQSRLDIEV